ncbi:mechanosensitive ion channel family protein [Geopsychrobacter electrodiphilus]|uniref:mechanosensitive ion channel family protein n=1 Tax=Geopsychrobacter electrodiphilus TaxID=225196 RepID=UPI000369EF4D|nr:mechanosensitive ion channel domain-containing protein [Geopsychrobacter electrodiphilus]
MFQNINQETLMTLVQEYALPLFWALLILFVGRLVARGFTSMIRRAMARAKIDETLISFTTHVTYIAMLAFVFIAALGKLGVETTSFAAVLAAAGLAIGLSLQGSLSNFASGVILILFRPFKAGDFVEAGGVAGAIEEIQIFSTKIRSPDNKQIIVPNGQITSSTIVNYSAKETRRIDLVIGVSYKDDLKKVRTVLQEILANEQRVLVDPAPVIGLLELGDSSVNFAVRPWVSTGDYWPVRFDLLETIKLRFDAEGISIPFPQRDLHIVSGKVA